MPTTPNKGYEVQVTGTNAGAWGAVLNDDVISLIDNNLGGIVTLSLSSSNVTLTATQSEAVILRLIGTLTANIVITTLCRGFFFVENLTAGSFSVSIRNSSVATAAVVPQNSRATLISDTTNGVRQASTPEFPSGTTMLFVQAAAPVGWTKSLAHDNKALRVVSGTPSSGGSVSFTTAFASKSVVGTVGNTTLTISQIPLHGHPLRITSAADDGNGTGGVLLRSTSTVQNFTFTGEPTNTRGEQLGGTGGGQAHNHTFTGTPIDLAVAYVDALIAVKD